jgi:hypothetical protein
MSNSGELETVKGRIEIFESKSKLIIQLLYASIIITLNRKKYYGIYIHLTCHKLSKSPLFMRACSFKQEFFLLFLAAFYGHDIIGDYT